MAPQEKNGTCTDLVLKLTTGKSLNDEEKTHLAGCEDCMARVVNALDERAAFGKAAGRNGEICEATPEARKALEHGRSVFQREFGLSPCPEVKK